MENRRSMELLLKDVQSYASSLPYPAWIAIGIFGYLFSIATYNLFFHPLAGFPGPKIAAVSRWYEFYYDAVKQGKYVYKIEEMHKKYGPIVRINPYEIVINDPKYYNEVYVAANTRRTEIWGEYMAGVGFDDSHFMTENHELHRRRRKPLEPFFSRLGIGKIEDMIVDEARHLDSRMQSLKGSKAIVRLEHVFSAFAGDMISKICSEDPQEMMSRPAFGEEWHDLIERIVLQINLFLHFPQLVHLARLIPTGLLHSVFPGAAGFNEYRETMVRHIEQSKRDDLNGKEYDEKASKTLFRYIAQSDMPASEQTTERLSKEGMVLFGAGTATTARTMGFISYYVLANSHMRERLGKELGPLMADYPQKIPKWSELEKLPYLAALIKEGLRLSYGVMRHLPRVSPDVALQYKQWTIPKGTPVGIGAYSLHSDPEVYPEPFKFIPERWLGEYNPRMNENWIPFTRGSRSCLGMNLAYCEMYHALAVLFRPNGPKLHLYETDESDVAQAVDFLVPLPKLDSRGTRVTIE